MFERFTDRARKVMALASQEAIRFNHEYIGTEHILLGLVKEASGVGANVLMNLYVDLGKVRKEVEKIVKSGPTLAMTQLPKTPRAKKVIEFAIEEARKLGHDYVGTEHLLLGLFCEHDGVAAQILMNLGLKLEDVHNEIMSLNQNNSLNQNDLVKKIATLTEQKDDMIRNAEYQTAALIRDQIEKSEAALAKRFNLSAKEAKDIIGAAKKSMQLPQWDVKTVMVSAAAGNKSHRVLGEIAVAEAGVRDLLAAVASNGDISVIEQLTKMIATIVSLHAYYVNLQKSDSTHSSTT